MRLDKYLTETNTATRKEAAAAARSGAVTVNGEVVRDASARIDENTAEVIFRGEKVIYRRFTYIMLNKPEGYVSATDDKSAPPVLELIPPKYRKGLFPCGRLDKYTVGLMLLTDDGVLSHTLLSPKHHIEKEYFFRCEKPLSRIAELESGVHIEGGYLTKPCRIVKTDDFSANITLTEGKYHQIKQMLHAVGNKVTFLERVRFGALTIENAPERGKWRFLTDEETAALRASAENVTN